MAFTPFGVGTVKWAMLLLMVWLEPDSTKVFVQLINCEDAKLSENTGVAAANGIANKKTEIIAETKMPSNFLTM